MATQMPPPHTDRGRSPMSNSNFDMTVTNSAPCLAAAKNFEEECQNTRVFDPNIRMVDGCKLNLVNMHGPSSSNVQQMNLHERPQMTLRDTRERNVWGRNSLIDPTLIGGSNPNARSEEMVLTMTGSRCKPNSVTRATSWCIWKNIRAKDYYRYGNASSEELDEDCCL